MFHALITTIIATPVGMIHLWGDDAALHGARIEPKTRALANPDQVALAHSPVALAGAELARYFAGEIITFTCPLAPLRSARGEQMRGAIMAVPYGDTASYGEIARRIGSGPRAIGGACRTNPFPIIVPCHRIVSANPATSYYSGADGPATKAWLIAHEQKHRALA